MPGLLSRHLCRCFGNVLDGGPVCTIFTFSLLIKQKDSNGCITISTFKLKQVSFCHMDCWHRGPLPARWAVLLLTPWWIRSQLLILYPHIAPPVSHTFSFFFSRNWLVIRLTGLSRLTFLKGIVRYIVIANCFFFRDYSKRHFEFQTQPWSSSFYLCLLSRRWSRLCSDIVEWRRKNNAR